MLIWRGEFSESSKVSGAGNLSRLRQPQARETSFWGVPWAKLSDSTVRTLRIGGRMTLQKGRVAVGPGRASKGRPLPNSGQAGNSEKERRVRLSFIQAFGCDYC